MRQGHIFTSVRRRKQKGYSWNPETSTRIFFVWTKKEKLITAMTSYPSFTKGIRTIKGCFVWYSIWYIIKYRGLYMDVIRKNFTISRSTCWMKGNRKILPLGIIRLLFWQTNYATRCKHWNISDKPKACLPDKIWEMPSAYSTSICKPSPLKNTMPILKITSTMNWVGWIKNLSWIWIPIQKNG